jgi:DNA polymerase-3 subunit beta
MMKIYVERNDLMKALGHSHSVVEKKTTIPALSHVLLQTEGTKLKITATDLELTIIEVIDADVEMEGSATVLESMFYEIVRKLPDGAKITLQMKENGNQLLLNSGASRFTLSCLPTKEFPSVQITELPYHFKIPAKDLLRLLNRTEFAMSTEETRYYLNGIYIHPYQNQELRAVATDGHRLARVSVPLPEGAEDFPGIIISRKTVNEILKILPDQNSDVDVRLSETQITFTFENVFLSSRLIDGVFPDYEKAIPNGNNKVVRLQVNPFLKAVERVAIISSEHSRGLKIEAQSGKLILSSVSSEIGSAVEEIEAHYGAESIEIGFNSKYLMDIAKQMENDEAEFSFADTNTAVIIQNLADARSLYVLMPMRV